jgi:ubiquitin carboxyl-terminal hydrolase 1
VTTQELCADLNTPQPNPGSYQPIELIQALSNHSADKNNSLFSSREHQDAQELFQFLSECIKAETAAIDKEGHRDPGLGGLAQSREKNREIGKNVFDGLTANRRSCVECGYTEAVMHFAFDNWQLAVPRLAVRCSYALPCFQASEMLFQAGCKLEDCLDDYTRLELLTDCICRKCSMLATHKRLLQEADKLAEATKSEAKPSSKKSKRAREARKMAALVKAALDEGRIEEEIKDLRMERVFSKASTKQVMIARVRCFHWSSSSPTDKGHVASPCPSPSHQPLRPLRPVCFQE